MKQWMAGSFKDGKQAGILVKAEGRGLRSSMALDGKSHCIASQFSEFIMKPCVSLGYGSGKVFN